MVSKIIRADGTTELASIKSVTYHESVNADIDLRPGCVASSYIEVTCFGQQTDAPTVGEALTYYQVVGETETLIGIFYAKPSIPTKNSYSFVAYDAVHKLDADFSAWLSAHQDDFPYTVYQLVSQACTIAGVTLGSSSWANSTMEVNAWYADSITCRNILQYAAEIACKFVRCNTSGEIVFDWYTTVSQDTRTASGEIASFDYGADGVPLKSLVAQIVPVQTGSGDPSPDNVRPISGWEECIARRTGKNLLRYRSDMSLPRTYRGITYAWSDDGGITVSGTAVNDSFQNLTSSSQSKTYPVMPGKTYYFSTNVESSVKIQLFVNGSSVGFDNNITYTMPDDLTNWYVRLRVANGVNLTTPVTVYPFICLNEETDKSYEPFVEETLSVSWQSTAGTVYGGNLVVNEDGSGVLTVDDGEVDMGDLTYSQVTSGGITVFRNAINAKPVSDYNQHGLTSIYPFAGTRFIASMPDKSWIIDANGRFIVRDDSYSDASSFKNAMVGQTLVYELATPLTYNLTTEQLTTLPGTNNIWATTGDVTVEYYYQLGRIYPTTGTFNDEECYAYKQDGLTYDNYDTSALARVAVHPVGEDDVAYYYPTDVTSGNTLDITNNALLYGASAADMSVIAQTVYDGIIAVGQYRPMDVSMFPNECPFRSGQIVPVTDAQGVSFTTAIMSKVVTDSAVTLASTGREVYGDYALDTAKKLVQLAADIVRINKLKVDWAEIDQIFARDITVTGQLHSEDYSYTDGEIYANQGMGMDFGEKRYNTPNFGITPDGNVYAQGGKISGFNIQKGEYEEVTPSAPTYTGTGYTYADGYLEVTEDGTATFDVPLTATVGGVAKPLTRIVYQCYYGQPSSIPSTFRYSFYYLDSGDNPISGLGGMLEYEPYGGTALRSVIPNANYLSQSSSLTFSVQIRSGSACRIYYQYGNYYSLYTENGEIGTGETNVYVGDDGISVGEKIILTPDGNAKIYSLDLTDTAGVASPDDDRLMKAKDIYDELSQKVDTSLIPFAVSDGGTGQTGVEVTSTVSDVITASTNYTVTSMNFSKWGKVAQLTMKIKRSSAVTITSLTAIATLKSGYRPVHNAFAASPASAIDKCYVNESGVIYVTGTLAANTEYSIFSTFILP